MTTLSPLRTLSLVLLGLSAALAGCASDENTGPGPTLEAPTGVAAAAQSATLIRVTWNPVAGATSYTIQRAVGAGQFTTAGTAAGSPFDDNGLTPDTQYRYRVQATAAGGQSQFSGEASATTLAGGPTTVEITQDITANTTWTADQLYRLKGFIHVANGATLTIEPGTRIEGDFDVLGSSLFVLRGARIDAQGTADDPIVFTSSRPVGQRQAGDWGGLILVGNGIINRGTPVILEGTGTGGTNVAVDYSGGTNNADDSGILRYVRVEFAGYATAQDAELNTFTFAAVGSGTTLEYLQSLNGLDDAFEWFGGAVDAKYLVSYNSGDDHFDMSEGYVGRIQHAIAYQTRTVVPRANAGNISSDPQGIENDGCAGANCLNGQNSLPLTAPVVANFTLVGPPAAVTNSSGNIGMMLRRGTGGFYVNGVVGRWSRAAISLRDQPTLDRIGEGNLLLRNLYVIESPVVFQPQTGATVQGSVDLASNEIETNLAGSATAIFSSLPAGEPANAGALDWSPVGGAAIETGGLETFEGELATRAGTFVTPTAWRGAAEPGGVKWWEGWTRFAVN